MKQNFSNESLGKMIRAMRSCAGVTQIDFGKMLSLQQAAISRIESGSQYLTPEQLYMISQFFGVSMDEIIAGEVNFWAIATKFGRKPPLPPRYQDLPFSKVRESLPFLNFFNEAEGAAYAESLLKSLTVNPMYVRSPDETIGVQFTLDILRKAIDDQVLRKQRLPEIVAHTRTRETQGFLHQIYQCQDSALSLIQSWVLNAHHYENNFNYQIENLRKDSVEVSIKPHSHMKSVAYHDATLGDFLCEYKKLYLSELPKYAQLNPLKIEERECHYHGGSQCLYVLTVA